MLEFRNKAGFLCRCFQEVIAGNDDLSTVVCAPVDGELLGLRSEVAIGTKHGVPRDSSIRCDFLMPMFKHKLTGFVAPCPIRNSVN
jgi:hypothetical protein